MLRWSVSKITTTASGLAAASESRASANSRPVGEAGPLLRHRNGKNGVCGKPYAATMAATGVSHVRAPCGTALGGMLLPRRGADKRAWRIRRFPAQAQGHQRNMHV